MWLPSLRACHPSHCQDSGDQADGESGADISKQQGEGFIVSVPTAGTAMFRGSHTRRERSIWGSVSAALGQPLLGHHFQAQLSCLPGTLSLPKSLPKEVPSLLGGCWPLGIRSDAASPLPAPPGGSCFPSPRGRAQSARLSTALPRLPLAARCLLPHTKEPARDRIHFRGLCLVGKLT